MRHQVVAALAIALWLPAIALCGSLGQTSSDTPKVTVTVNAMHPWLDTGLSVRKGDRVSFAAVGTIQWGTQPDQVAGPEGHEPRAGTVGKGGLIGRVGITGKPFAIGNTREPIVMPKNGELFLGINDFVFGDNTGAFAVTIARPVRPQ